MDRLRLWITALVIWLTFLFNIENVLALLLPPTMSGESINILYSYTYVFIITTTAFVLLLPNLRDLALAGLLTIFIILYLLLTLYWHREGVLTRIPFTITQVCALIVTVLLARQVNFIIKEFELAVMGLTLNQMGQLPLAFDHSQGAMYNEVKRARRYQRPISVIAFKFKDNDLKMGLPKMMEQVNRAGMRQYTITHIAHALESNTQDFETVALWDNHFLIILPEKDKDQLPNISNNLLKIVEEKTDVRLRSGYASYPEDAITFEGLIALAISNSDPPSQSTVPGSSQVTTVQDA